VIKNKTAVKRTLQRPSPKWIFWIHNLFDHGLETGEKPNGKNSFTQDRAEAPTELSHYRG
jgi:hypothetical protein